jgi:hypothetical protein
VRRPSRIIEIFSMSVLDMFASALGAFILISIILFPKYNQYQKLEAAKREIKSTEDKLAKSTADLKKKEQESKQQQEEINLGANFQTALQACKQTMAACQAAVTSVFLVIGIEWDDPCDIDLYVTDPDGREFNYRPDKRTQNGSKAQLSIDMRFGPGVEVWQNPEAKVGAYKIKYRRASCAGSASLDVPVRGWILDRSAGLRALSKVALTNGAPEKQIATVFVSRDGLISIQE